MQRQSHQNVEVVVGWRLLLPLKYPHVLRRLCDMASLSRQKSSMPLLPCDEVFEPKAKGRPPWIKNLPPQFGQQHWGQLLEVEVQLDLLNSSFSRGASKLRLLVSLLRSTSPLSQGDGVPWFSPPIYFTCNYDDDTYQHQGSSPWHIVSSHSHRCVLQTARVHDILHSKPLAGRCKTDEWCSSERQTDVLRSSHGVSYRDVECSHFSQNWLHGSHLPRT